MKLNYIGSFTMSFMWEEIMQQPNVLNRCIRANEDVMDALIAEIRQRNIKFVVIAARGTSDNAAVYGKYVFEILTGIPIILAAPSVFTVYNGSLKFENSLVIGVSQSGEALDVSQVLKSGNEKGAITVSITNFPNSPLAKMSHYDLFCDAGLEKSVAATKTFTSQMYLLGNLAAKLANNDDLIKEFSTVSENLLKIFESADDIKKIAERYHFVKEMFVLARGINYCIALETALKVQETTYVGAKAFATSDFHHGPMAMVEKGTPVIIYAPSGPSLIDVQGMISELKNSEADLLVVSDKQEICALGNCSVKLPCSGSDFISPFYNIAVAQMLACSLALEKGLNPDNPRILKKVTLTC
jgi:glucosamine--fructose-6-phosphate aminotransferase (isomerizing)